MARFLPYVLPVVALLNISPVYANFIVQSPPADTGPEFSNQTSSGNPTSSTGEDSGQPVRWKMAYGFGNNIPLQFACRQIVPSAVKVAYGPGVNPEIHVSWQGGQTWNHVLRDTVKPLGLSLQMSFMSVTIVKK